MFSSNSVFYMTALVLLGMAALFYINFSSIVSGHAGPQTYLQQNKIQGMAIVHKNLPYTLNFEQQAEVVNILNQSIPIVSFDTGNFHQAPNFEQLVVYLFDKPASLTITPVVYVDDQLVYTAPGWNPNGYMKEVSRGRLKQLFEQSFDP